MWAQRPGRPKVLELRQPLHFIDDQGLEINLSVWDLENYVIRKLQECDVWKHHGTGKAFDDYLYQRQVNAEKSKKESFRKERIAMLKQDRPLWEAAMWNAAHGRFTNRTAKTYNTPTEFFAAEETKNIQMGDKSNVASQL